MRDEEIEDIDREPGSASDDFARRIGRASPAPVPWQAAEGDVIAERYVLEAKIGEGGLGVVHRAYDPVLKRKVAIKLLGVVEDNETFLREARATARVLHPNVVTIHDCGVEVRTAYLVLELLEGTTLARRVDGREAMPLADALPILSDIASALTRAHDNLVTHRDLSWNNVFLTDDEQVKVLDFGFSKLAEQKRRRSMARRLRSEDAGLSATDPWFVGGTPRFAPPEQLVGEDVPFKGDLFSLGVLAFRLLTGEFPFPGDTLDAYQATLLTKAAPRLRDRLPGAPRELDRLVAELLDRSPETRPATREVRDLLRALRDELASTRKKPKRSPSVLGEPFRPLCTFEKADAHLFFGRDREAAALERVLAAKRLVVLHGVSGAGKSSLVRAGLLPKLGDDVFVMTAELGADPTRSPLEMLRDCVRAELNMLGEAPTHEGVDALLVALGRREKRKVLLVLDQFEEVFLARSQERFQSETLELGQVLQRVLETTQVAVQLLIVIRTDYHGHLECLKPAMPGILRNGVLLLPLDADATRKAIEGPFEAAGFEFPRGLVEEMIVDLSQEGAVSPVELELVCHALYECGLATGQRVLERDDYDRLGGAGKVLGQHLAQLEKQWSPERVHVARAILFRLVSNEGVRMAPMSAAALTRATSIPTSDIEETLELLRKARIVVPLRLSSGEHGYRIWHDKMALAVWERLGARERREVALRDALRTLQKHAPEGSIAFGLWWWAGKHADRAVLLAWYAEGARGADDTEKAFLERISVWERRRSQALWLGICCLVVMLLLASGGYAFVQRNRLRIQELEEAKLSLEKIKLATEKAWMVENLAERELQRDPGKAMAWLVEQALPQSEFGFDSDCIGHNQWLIAQEAWRSGIGWVAAQHEKKVRHVMFSPPELLWMQAAGVKECKRCWPARKLLFSVGEEGKVRVLDLELGGKAELLRGGSEFPVSHVVLSPNGEWLAVGDEAGDVHTWEWKEDKNAWAHHVLAESDSWHSITAMDVSADAAHLALGRDDGTIELWDVSGWKLIWTNREYREHTPDPGNTIRTLAFSPRDGRLFALTFSGVLIEIDVRNGKSIPERSVLSDIPHFRPSFSREGDRFAMPFRTDRNIIVGIFPIVDASGQPRGGLEAEDELLGLRSLDGQLAWGYESRSRIRLVTTDYHGVVEVQNAYPSRNRRYNWTRMFTRVHSAGMVPIVVSRDYSWLVTGSEDKAIRMTPLETSRVYMDDIDRVFRGHEDVVISVTLSPDNRFLASGSADGEVRIWEARVGAPLRTWRHGPRSDEIAPKSERRITTGFRHGDHDSKLRGDGPPIRGRCVMTDGSAVTGYADGELVLSSRSGNRHKSWTSKEPVKGLLCLPDGRIVQAGEASLQVWHKEGNPMVLAHFATQGPVLASNAGGAVVSGSSDGTISIWDLDTKTRRASEPFLKASISGITAMGEHEVAVGLRNGDIWFWDWVTFQKHTLEPARQGTIASIAAFVDARLMAIGAEDGTIRLQWVDSGASRDFHGHQKRVGAVQFSTDGRFLTSSSSEPAILAWPLPPTDRSMFRAWLNDHTPWTIQDGKLVPKPVPALSTGFGGPEPPRPTEACIEACRKAQPNDGPPDGETMESCVIKQLVPACETNF
ncbi:protein kinase [Polyangium sp. 15x6]|uniref:nSTAND1 domain-containing NTPase n=1 Tax=Polyangium sp. 15x6 TaxID=3042687 RepID=UPI00249AFF67|nr:protein kinase [Polyangium sp. 15x6]MDI3291879.1 protein kinase [Polyangium sp. 15x6]